MGLLEAGVVRVPSPMAAATTRSISRAPVLGTGEILAEADKELAWIALEDLQALDRRPWHAGISVRWRAI